MSLGLSLTSLTSVVAGIALTASGTAPLAPVTSLDLHRFMGQWIHLAAIPQSSAQPCLREASSFFELNPDNTVWLMGNCLTHDGAPLSTDGTATVTDAVTHAQMHITDGAVGASGPTNYVVTFVDDTYSLAVAGHPNRSTGFVLSRTASVPAATWQKMTQVVKERGWDPCHFWTVPAAQGHQLYQPLCTVGTNMLPMPGPSTTPAPFPTMPVPPSIPPGESLPPGLPQITRGS